MRPGLRREELRRLVGHRQGRLAQVEGRNFRQGVEGLGARLEAWQSRIQAPEVGRVEGSIEEHFQVGPQQVQQAVVGGGPDIMAVQAV